MSTTRPQPRRERIRSSRPASSRRAAVGGDHDLPAAIDQRVEGVEELLLGAVLAADELDVVDHQHVDRAEHLLEAHGVLEAQRLDELVHELLGREVDHLARRVLAADLPGDRVHQVGLAEPDAAVEEQRVERRRGELGDALGGGERELVGLADDEVLEGAARVERGADVAVERPRPSASGRSAAAGAAGARRRRLAGAGGAGVGAASTFSATPRTAGLTRRQSTRMRSA